VTDKVPGWIVNAIYETISDPELIISGTGVFWEEFAFTERAGFDVAVLKEHLEFYINDWLREHSEQEPLVRDNGKEIALKLRDIARQHAGMPLLTEEEKAAWVYEAPTYKSYWWRPAGNPLDTPPPRDDHKLTHQEIDDIISYIAKTTPRVFDYVEAMDIHYKSLEPDPFCRDPKNIKPAWPDQVISDAIVNIFGAIGPRRLDSALEVRSEILRLRTAGKI
jgi:hypothetical protein